jgi:hypothetical protein
MLFMYIANYSLYISYSISFVIFGFVSQCAWLIMCLWNFIIAFAQIHPSQTWMQQVIQIWSLENGW